MSVTTGPAPASTRTGGRAGGGGCGCGCGCGGKGGGCGQGDTAPAAGSAFVRPRFFGGMLLTEDDLQAVTDYVVGKRRLTNRYVIGTGVVCGLDVSCDPCEPRSVVVGPGYAVDCCGNDVVVECATRVDVVSLWRELRERGRADCGEPCEEHGCEGYVLNIVYTETPTEPVAPYADDTCAVGDCEFSRVREGYRFELSHCPHPDEPNLIEVVQACGDLDEDEQVKEDAAVMANVVRIALSRERQAEAEGLLTLADEKPPTKAEIDAADRDEAPVVEVRAVVQRIIATLVDDAAHREGRAGFRGLNPARRDLLRARVGPLAARLRDPEELVKLEPALRRSTERLIEVAEALEGMGTADLSRLAGPPVAATAPPAPAAERAEEEQVYLRDAPRMQARVLRRLADAGRSGCREYRDIASLKFLRLDEQSGREARELAHAYISLLGCVCGAANPRCPTCTDSRVPLARVQVEDCEVVDICDLERSWVHSPRALAYWFPVVDALRELLEQRCCSDDCGRRQEASRYGVRKAPVRQPEDDLLRSKASMLVRTLRPPEAAPVLRDLVEALGDRVPGPGSDVWARTAATGGDDARVAVLEKQVAELTRKLEGLAARGESGGRS